MRKAAQFLLAEGLVSEVVDTGVGSSDQEKDPRVVTRDSLALSPEESRLDPYSLAAVLLAKGRADLAIAGIACPTATVLRAGIKLVVSSPVQTCDKQLLPFKRR